MLVQEILKHKGTKVVTTDAGQTIAATASLLTREKIGAVVVADARGQVAGIMSERDIVRGVAERGEKALSAKVGDLMTSDVLSCKPDDSLNDLMAMMTSRRVRHLPVMEAGELKGIVSIGDVVKHRLEEVQMEVDVLQDYVRGGGS